MTSVRERAAMLFGGRSRGRLAQAWGVLTGREGWFSNWHSQFGSSDDAENAMSIFPRWVTAYHRGDRTYGSTEPLISDRDERIEKLNAQFPVEGRSVLELGPLECGHTKQMLDLGAKRVVAVESNPEAFLKCLTAKSALGLDRAEVIFGDCNRVIERFVAGEQTFDVCSAIGIIYHFSNPVSSIRRICEAAPVTYVWTHVASSRQPGGEWTTVSEGTGPSYRGRVNHYGTGTHLGGIDPTAVWLTEESLEAVFRDLGREVQILEREAHPHGDCVLLIAKKSG